MAILEYSAYSSFAFFVVNTFDILFIEKGLSIKPSTLVQAKKLQPALKIVSYTLDDMMNTNNSSFNFRKSLKLYDMLFTNKRYNVTELKNIGAKKRLDI